MKKSVLILFAVVLTYPCSNGRILEEGKSDMSSSKIDKMGRTSQSRNYYFN
jgi:hypothetical protein